MSEKNKGGGGNSGEGQTYHKTPPQKRFWTPPLMIRFPPPLRSRNVILLTRNGHRPDKSHFLRPQNWVWRGHFIVCFPAKKSHDTFCPPLCEFPRMYASLARSPCPQYPTTQDSEFARSRALGMDHGVASSNVLPKSLPY